MTERATEPYGSDGPSLTLEMLEREYRRWVREPLLRRVWVRDLRTLTAIKQGCDTGEDPALRMMGVPLYMDREQMPVSGEALLDYRTDEERREDESAGLTAYEVYRQRLRATVRRWLPGTGGSP